MILLLVSSRSRSGDRLAMHYFRFHMLKQSSSLNKNYNRVYCMGCNHAYYYNCRRAFAREKIMALRWGYSSFSDKIRTQTAFWRNQVDLWVQFPWPNRKLAYKVWALEFSCLLISVIKVPLFTWIDKNCFPDYFPKIIDFSINLAQFFSLLTLRLSYNIPR